MHHSITLPPAQERRSSLLDTPMTEQLTNSFDRSRALRTSLAGILLALCSAACTEQNLDAAPLAASTASPLANKGLPADPQQARIDLGRKLFFDGKISRPEGVSCGMCHNPQEGWGDGRPQGKGVQDHTLAGDVDGDGKDDHNSFQAVKGNYFKTVLTPRNTPTIYNAELFPNQFWDGRAGELEHQAVFPVEAGFEMNAVWDDLVLPYLNADAEYADLFLAAFGDPLATKVRAGEAIGAYERTIVVSDTPYDAFLAGNPNALTQTQKHGHNLFFGKAGCFQCHPGPSLTDFQFHNTGVPTAGNLVLSGELDFGFGKRMDLTQDPPVQIDDPADYMKFKTPQLRMVGVTRPFMHNGAFATLEEVVDFYNNGGGPDLSGTGSKNPLIVPLGLTATERADLVEFLRKGLMGTEIR